MLIQQLCDNVLDDEASVLLSKVFVLGQRLILEIVLQASNTVDDINPALPIIRNLP